MPLSDHEQKILQEIERQLYEQDPKFARTVASKSRKGPSTRNLRRGILLFAAGLVALFGYFITINVPLGVVSFLLMLGGATLAYNGVRRSGEERAKRRATGEAIGKRLRDLPTKMRKLRRKDSD